MDRLSQDVRDGLRQMLRHRSFAAIVVLTLALGIGVNALIFSFADLVVFRPLPIRDIDTAASLWMTHPERGDERVQVSYADYLEWRDQVRSLTELAARTYRSYNLTGVEQPSRILAAQATASLFPSWDIRAVRGRVFDQEEDRPGAERVALLSHGFWERQFGRDPGILGRVVRLDGEPYAVVGVLDPAIEIGGLSEVALWTPLAPDADPLDREERNLRVSGRLAPDTTLEEAAAELAALAARQSRDQPATNAGWGVRVVSMREGMMGPNTHLLIALLSLAVGFVLAIACANVANLMLVRSAARSRETAVRAALGAGRGRLVRQLVTEGAVLSLLGGCLGLILAWSGLRVIRSSTYEPAFQFVEINWRVLLFTAGISLLTPLIFGLVPALRAAGEGLATALKEGAGRSLVGGAGGRGRSVLVVAQLSLAVILLAVAGLNVRAAIELQRLDMGFEREELVTMRIDLPRARYPDPERLRIFADALLERLAAAPSARGVAASAGIPVVDGSTTRSLAVLGAEGRPLEAAPWAAETVVTPGFFDTLGIPVTEGRGFTREDGAEAAPVAVVSRAFASRYLSGGALGRRIRLGDDAEDPWREVVGVCGDLVNPNLTLAPQPQVYVPFHQRPERSLAILVRSADTAGIAGVARAEIARLDPDQVLWEARSFDQVMREELNFARVFIALFAIFGVSAMAMAGLGLYGVISYGVSQRRRELGLRIALGARSGDVLRMVVGQGALFTAIGLALGIGGGLAMGRAMAGALLVGVSPTDPATFAGVSLCLAAVALLASWVPARRATRVDPIQALRVD
jgi:predicted permease